MRNFITTTAFLLASTLCMYGQESNPNSAELAFDTETINYGTIEKNANGAREFTFTNTGKEPLIISNCVGSCGCTVPQWPRTPIAPGESAAIKVKYDTRRVGRFQKTVTVQSNSKTPTKVLTIKGNVKDIAAVNTSPVKKSKESSKISK